MSGSAPVRSRGTRALHVVAWLSALLAAAPALHAQGDQHIRLDYTEETLPNGLKVIYHVDRSVPIASVVVWYDVGSKHEEPGRTGFAHLFEHLMLFTGSRNLADNQAFALVGAAGGRPGPDINGTTSWDRTNYFQQLPSQYLEMALWIESDRMATLDEVLNQAKLDNQREVVKNERREGVDNQPYGLFVERMQANMFPDGHPYRHPIVGFMEDLDRATLDDVRAFFRTYYVPNNAVLVVAGDIDLPEAQRLVRQYFGGIPRGAEPRPMRSATVPALLGRSAREVIQDANAPAPAVYVGFRVPNAREPEAAAVATLGNVIGSGRASPLHVSLVREKQVATNIFTGNLGLVDGSDIFVIGVTGRPGANADSLEATVLAEIDRIAEMIDEAGLQRVRAASRFGLVNQMQNMGGFGGRADLLAQGWTYYRDAGWINDWVRRLDAVSVADLRALAAQRLVPTNRAVLVFVPAPRGEGSPEEER